MAHPVYNLEDILQRVHVDPLPAFPVLDAVVEWNDVDGTPVFENQQNVWERFLPSTLLARTFANTPAGNQFVNGMLGNAQTFFVDCRLGPGLTPHKKRSLLGMILKEDLKRLVVAEIGHGIQITKVNAALIPFDAQYPFQELRTYLIGGNRKSVAELIEEINLNSARGQPGPGSFPCREPHCTVTPWGPEPGQSVNLHKKFTCASTNVVYLIHCEACIQERNWTTYVGETARDPTITSTGNLHQRLAHHISQLCDEENRENYPLDDDFPNIIFGRFHGDPDLDELTRDTYCHFNYHHDRADRRITILDGGFGNDRSVRRRHEFLYQLQIGNFQYNTTTHTGSLNPFI